MGTLLSLTYSGDTLPPRLSNASYIRLSGAPRLDQFAWIMLWWLNQREHSQNIYLISWGDVIRWSGGRAHHRQLGVRIVTLPLPRSGSSNWRCGDLHAVQDRGPQDIEHCDITLHIWHYTVAGKSSYVPPVIHAYNAARRACFNRLWLWVTSVTIAGLNVFGKINKIGIQIMQTINDLWRLTTSVDNIFNFPSKNHLVTLACMAHNAFQTGKLNTGQTKYKRPFLNCMSKIQDKWNWKESSQSFLFLSFLKYIYVTPSDESLCNNPLVWTQ